MPNPIRREFLVETASSPRHSPLPARFTPALARAAWARRTVGPVVAVEPFGRLEAIGANVWALISTPLGGDFTTVSNGGIIAGKDGVLVYEGLTRPAGAKWLAERAKDLRQVADPRAGEPLSRRPRQRDRGLWRRRSDAQAPPDRQHPGAIGQEPAG